MYTPVSVFRNSLKYGLILGMISILYVIILYVFDQLFNYWLTFIPIILTYILVHLGIKEHKSDQGGFIDLGKAIIIGLLVVVISSVLISLFDITLKQVIDPDLAKMELLKAEELLVNMGMDEDQIEQNMKMQERFQHPIVRFLVSVLGSPCTGIIFALIAGLILQKAPPYSNP